jgi:AcrR family transcriptional regulator
MSGTARRDPDRRGRKRRSDGERSRNAILREAGQLATVEGIEGLSIARLADAVGMSKSGLFAHFGSKEELQLATVDAAIALFTEQVIEPASSAPTGLERLHELGERFLHYVEHGVFAGGCFFASVLAEVDTRPGPVRERVLAVEEQWLALFGHAARDAQAEGAIDPSEDPAQLAFELNSYLLHANMQFVATGTSLPIERARRALERRLAAARVAKP